MVKITRTPTPPASLAKRTGACYREKDVILQLRDDSHGKCYLCERDAVQSPEVEHLKPHEGDPALKYDWNNLFFSCSHCNSVKNQQKFNGKIIDCCKVDPEAVLKHTFADNHVKVEPLDGDEKTIMTAELLTECFENNKTGVRFLECEELMKSLQATMNVFYRTLSDYREQPTEETREELAFMLSRAYKFAGFTRASVRSLADAPPELQAMLA